MKVDLQGKIRNTQLPKAKPLLPMFEAVVNSLQAVEDASEPVLAPRIDVFVERHPALPGMDVDGQVSGFAVTDNGVGFNDVNLDSFFTSDTQYKAGKGGKGIGRFIWLKAFQYAEIESHYRDNGTLLERAFKFTTEGEQPDEPAKTSQEVEPKTTVRLAEMQSPYKENCTQVLAEIGHRLIEHCLPFFLDPQCPLISIGDGKERIDLNQYFRENFADKASQHTFNVRETAFTLRGLRLYNPHETTHRLIYAANSREVTTERLDRQLPNLQRKLSDLIGDFVYLGFLESEFLNQNVNNERTSFSFPERSTVDGLFGDEITLEAIRTAALNYVSSDLQPFLEDINTEKRETINAYITDEAPQYKPLFRYLDEFIDTIPPGTAGRALELALHEQFYERQRQLKEEGHGLIEEADEQSLQPDEYEAKLNDFLERENELGKSSLAQYVAHRKVILEFLEKSLQADQAGKYPLEEVIHRIIYPMRATSDDVPYEQQNLWIIDERLTYHGFLASDMPLDTAAPLANASRSRPDIMIFDRALSFSEDAAVLSSLVIVEFKKPDRSDFRKEDPVDQVYRLIREIRGGHFKDKNGREIKVQSERIPAYAYVICDKTAEIDRIAQNKSMLPTPDNLGYYVYNQPLSSYVEIISYTKLLADAKKRNRILFDKLNLPSAR